MDMCVVFFYFVSTSNKDSFYICVKKLKSDIQCLILYILLNKNEDTLI